MTLESGISIPFERMSSFEVNEVTERGADISITMLSGGIMSGRTYNSDAGFTATVIKDNLPLSLPAEKVIKVEFQR